MSNKYNSPFENMDWSEMQKHFVDAMTKNYGAGATNPFAGAASANPFASSANTNPFAGAASANPFTASASANPFAGAGANFSDGNWADAMELWWRTFKPESLSQNDNVFNKMMQQCRTYFLLGEQFSRMYEGIEKAKQNNDNYVQYLNEQFENLEAVMADNQQRFSWAHLIEQCEQPAELLQNLLTNSPMFTGDGMNDFSPELRKLREKFLTMPGVGYNRESQEKLQEALHLWAIYQDNSQEFNAVMSKLNKEAVELMRKRMLQMDKDGEDIESMRHIYHIWVDSNEKVYGEFVMTDEYAEMNAKLVNSLMAFKSKSHEITEDYLSAMNLPTSGAIDALERRQYELRKQVRTIEAELKNMKSELADAKQKTAKKETKAATSDKTVAAKSKKSASNSKKKPASKRQAKAKKQAVKKDTQVVDFKKSQLAKQKKMQASGKAAEEISNADDKRMIEIKF